LKGDVWEKNIFGKEIIQIETIKKDDV